HEARRSYLVTSRQSINDGSGGAPWSAGDAALRSRQSVLPGCNATPSAMVGNNSTYHISIPSTVQWISGTLQPNVHWNVAYLPSKDKRHGMGRATAAFTVCISLSL